MLFPTSNISRSNQWPGLAKDVCGTAWLRIRRIVRQAGMMSFVIRHECASAGAQAEGKSRPQLQTWRTIGRFVDAIASLMFCIELYGVRLGHNLCSDSLMMPRKNSCHLRESAQSISMKREHTLEKISSP